MINKINKLVELKILEKSYAIVLVELYRKNKIIFIEKLEKKIDKLIAEAELI
jgi:hypothetical protein